VICTTVHGQLRQALMLWELWLERANQIQELVPTEVEVIFFNSATI